ncbi:MAG: hypothetical protein M5U07_18240 [Xanthobacteraceae bacterium]|nr:hypothetical protein [Xanthobacteraceae bacterium]
MTGKRSRPEQPTGRKRPVSRRQKEHLDVVLDEGLEETFPASDTPAVVEPVADRKPVEPNAG